jgi:hypothetical protein
MYGNELVSLIVVGGFFVILQPQTMTNECSPETYRTATVAAASGAAL